MNKEKCCGCMACYNICPSNAIEFIEDEYGFKYPKINEEKCTNCGLCKKVCPIKINKKENKSPKAYAVINKDEKTRMNSSSGGIFTLLAEEIIKNNGVVFGAGFDDDYNVVHSNTENIEELEKYRGSKYVQSTIGNSYKLVKKYLEEGRMVLFSGTPCQIEGLKSFLQKDYENLFTQDLICHGVPSPKVWKKYLQYRENKDGNKPVKINFRDKEDGWKLFNLKFYYNNGEHKENLNKDLYMKAFLKNLCLRDSCYECSFKKVNRRSDITLADFWGINNINPNLDDDKGTSLVIVNSDKGKKLFDKIRTNIISEEVNLEEAIIYNSAMIKSVDKNKNREKFLKDIDRLDFERLIKKYGKDSISFKKIINMGKVKIYNILVKNNWCKKLINSIKK